MGVSIAREGGGGGRSSGGGGGSSGGGGGGGGGGVGGKKHSRAVAAAVNEPDDDEGWERVGAPDSQKYVIPSCFLGYRGTVIVEDTDVKPVVALPTT